MQRNESTGVGNVIRVGVAAAVLSAGLGLWRGAASRADGPAADKVSPAVAAPAAAPAKSADGPRVSAASPVEAGRYLVRLGGCNDCHTPMFSMLEGKVPEAIWFTGSPVGFRGPWGTSYGSNLRLFVKNLSADDFVAQMRARTSRPPMPWHALHAMHDADLRAVHAYLTALGPAGQPAPEYVPPTDEPKTPYVNMMPVMPPAPAAKK